MKGEQAQALAHGKTPPTHEAPVPLQTIIINPKNAFSAVDLTRPTNVLRRPP
ncbi:hypothetical protein Fmac_017776 [Flemingia macrophylla]|uniref:Uncharacterized protein n=1 Tax=Flemingia macrophylla TaxID=520843 RepID=A0ABD1M315_9FABA